MDDMSLCHSVNLKDLQEINWPIEKPVNFRNRTMHHLPSNKNKLQDTMNHVHKFSEVQYFKVSQDKTHTVIFNTAITKDFYPRILNTDGVIYDNQDDFKILGINLSSHKKKGLISINI